MLHTFKNGQGSVVIRVKLLDSSSTVGAGLTGLTSASSGLIISTIADNEAAATAYTQAGSTIEGITTLGTYAAPTATKCRFKEVDATNHKGVYELQFADARFAVAAAKSLLVSIAGVTNLAQADFVVQLQTLDPHASVTQTGDSYAIVNSGTHGNAALKTLIDAVDNFVDTEVAAIKTVVDSILLDTAEIGAAGAGFTALPWNAAWDAQVQSEVQDAIEANHLDHLLAVDYDPAAKPGAATALLNELVESDAGVSRFTANALEMGPSGGSGVADWTADERTALRSILGIPASGTIPDNPTTGILDTIRGAVLVVDDFLDTEIAAIKAKTDNLPSDPADASDIAASFTTVNTKLDTIDDLLDTEVAAIMAETASIQADTNDIQTRLPAALVGGRMDSNLSAISNSTTTMAAFNRAVKTNVIGTVGVGSTTTSIVTSSVTPAPSVADQLKGLVIKFADDTTTAALRGQATTITASSASATPTLTVTALTTAAAAGDTFAIL